MERLPVSQLIHIRRQRGLRAGTQWPGIGRQRAGRLMLDARVMIMRGGVAYIAVSILREAAGLVIDSLAVLLRCVVVILPGRGQELSPRFGAVAYARAMVVVVMLGGEELSTLTPLARSADSLRSVKHQWGVRDVGSVSDAEGGGYGGHVSVCVVLTVSVTDIAVLCRGVRGSVTVTTLVGAVTGGAR